MQGEGVVVCGVSCARYSGLPAAQAAAAHALHGSTPLPQLLGSTADAEVLPWGIDAVQGTTKVAPTRTVGSGVTVCIVDSGLWGAHPDLVSNALSGCGMSAGAGSNPAAYADTCPFEWDADLVAHGSHVAGTIGAPANGRGVVGVIPGEAGCRQPFAPSPAHSRQLGGHEAL